MTTVLPQPIPVLHIAVVVPESQQHPTTGNPMVLVPAKEFQMGCATGSPAEQPVHTVRLPSFWVDTNPVTNAAFARFVAATDYKTTAEQVGHAWGCKDGKFDSIPGLSWKAYAAPDRADHPVVLVSWHDANAYCKWAGLRLLTEAEWECCARGGIDGADFPWGNSEPDGSQSNFARTTVDLPPTNPVGLMGVNPYGIADLVGNVWQWCADHFGADYYAQSQDFNPQGPASGPTKVRRGGSWNVIQGFRLRCANRGAAKPDTVAPNMGFRCARDA